MLKQAYSYVIGNKEKLRLVLVYTVLFFSSSGSMD